MGYIQVRTYTRDAGEAFVYPAVPAPFAANLRHLHHMNRPTSSDSGATSTSQSPKPLSNASANRCSCQPEVQLHHGRHCRPPPRPAPPNNWPPSPPGSHHQQLPHSKQARSRPQPFKPRVAVASKGSRHHAAISPAPQPDLETQRLAQGPVLQAGSPCTRRPAGKGDEGPSL